MSDINHIWNDGTPIRTRKRPCGCHITAKTFILCQRGHDSKKAADSWWELWQRDKCRPIDAMIIRSLQRCFEVHRDAYLQHLATGAD